MRFAIIASLKDIAGMNIAGTLISSHGFVQEDAGRNPEVNSKCYSKVIDEKELTLFIIEEDTIFFDAAENIDADYIIFATRHQSKSGEKTLSVHFPGNFSKAEYGGKDRELCTSATSLLKQSFINLNALGKDSGYNITLEATHHGPSLRRPVMFIEIGSNTSEWNDRAASAIIASTIIKTITGFKNENYMAAIGFGGTHYCQNFNEIESSGRVALSHICPKYHISSLDEDIIRKMLSSSDAAVKFALIDWKGIPGADRQHLITMLGNIGIPWKKTKDLE
jgi:D-aminoacyl-tRNA deacylase